MVELKIDPEFRDKIPPLTEAEFEQLQENILSDGEVYEPIVVWNGTIVDGHNRYKIVCKHPEIPYRTKEMNFADKWAAFDWMYKKQLGRRNLTDEQKTYLLGKLYEARKNTIGGNRGNQHTKVAGRQNGDMAKLRTKDIIAAEVGVGSKTVERAEKFSQGIDALKEVSEEAAEKVMSGNSGATKSAISELQNLTIEEVKQAADDIISGEVKKSNYRGWTKADREERAKLEAIVADMYDPSTVPEFTVDLLIDDIQINAAIYVDLLRNTLTDHSVLLTAENKPKIADAITKYVIKELEKVRSLVEK